MVEMMMKRADVFFERMEKYRTEEDRILDLIAEVLGFDWGDGTADDFRFDGYDRSFELDNVKNDFRASGDQCHALIDGLGFLRFWLNHLDGTETAYSFFDCAYHETRKDRFGKFIDTEAKVLSPSVKL